MAGRRHLRTDGYLEWHARGGRRKNYCRRYAPDAAKYAPSDDAKAERFGSFSPRPFHPSHRPPRRVFAVFTVSLSSPPRTPAGRFFAVLPRSREFPVRAYILRTPPLSVRIAYAWVYVVTFVFEKSRRVRARRRTSDGNAFNR